MDHHLLARPRRYLSRVLLLGPCPHLHPQAHKQTMPRRYYVSGSIAGKIKFGCVFYHICGVVFFYHIYVVVFCCCLLLLFVFVFVFVLFCFCFILLFL